MLGKFYRPGKASFIVGGQWGSEGKGAASAFAAKHLAECGKWFQIVTTNAGVQSGHTSVHNGVKRVFFHLPTYPAISSAYGYKPIVYLNAGSVIDPDVLFQELHNYTDCCDELIIHPNAAIITDECKAMEMRNDSSQTRIGSTRKGVGAALALKILRAGVTAKDVGSLNSFVKYHHNMFLANRLKEGNAVLVEIPQGYGLGIDAGFYPYCTSRNCTPMQAMSDAGLHPTTYGHTMMVIRTYPIRVGNITEAAAILGMNNEPLYEGKNILGYSGGCHADQYELTWDQIGVEPEITTVTKRVRRVFTFSHDQIYRAMAVLRPDIVYLTFCDYYKPDERREKLEHLMFSLKKNAGLLDLQPEIITQYGPSTDDVSMWSPGGI